VQGISKLGVQGPAVPARAGVRLTRQAARQLQQATAVDVDNDEPMSVEDKESEEPEFVDVDANDNEDSQLCTQYVRDIYEHLGEIEQRHRVMVQYMSSQKDINATMRGILIDWLVEVAEEYRLVPETLYLAVNYIDRFLQCVPVNRSKLQLVGVTCMLIASYVPQVRTWSARASASHARDAYAHAHRPPRAPFSPQEV